MRRAVREESRFHADCVRAVSEEDYIAWIEEQGGVVSAADDKPLRIGQTTASAKKEEKSVEWNMKEAMKRGETAYKTYCAACHQANGEGLGAFPALKNSQSPSAISPLI